MGGQCPGAPELKAPPQRETKKKMKNKKEKKKNKEKEEKKKRERNFSNTRMGAPTRYIPMSLK